MRHDPSARELVLKVVYCGPGMAGKSTNFASIRRRLPVERLTDLFTRDANSERAVWFSWRADELGEVHGHRVRVEFHTIPGQSYYAATRRQLLEGVDGIVFVADSRREALDENIDSMNELLGNLRQLKLPPDLPIILQYNKQDLPTAVPAEQLAPLMNPHGWPTFAAAAIDGKGVAETLQALLDILRERAATVDLPEPSEAPPSSWLLTCWRCQNMVDVPAAAVGAALSCPVCRSALEVVDADHGVTRQPAADIPVAELVDAARGAHAPSVATATASRMGEGQPFVLEGFTALKVLDRGPHGVRSRVRDTATGQTFRALVLDDGLLGQPGYRPSLDTFVALARDVQHPHLLPLAGALPAGQGFVLLAEDPEGYDTLAHILARRRALAPPHALGVLRGIALALDEAARRGLAHGWIRPEVVLLNEAGDVLLDELAVPPLPRFLVQESAGESAATEYYLPPEYLQDGIRPDVQSDIFLLGALLFRMITSEGQVTGYNAHEALHRILTNGPRRLRDAQPGLSRELDAFHQRLIAPTPAGRFRNYHELLDALDRFGGGARRQELQLTKAIAKPAPKRATQTTGPHPRRPETVSVTRPRSADSSQGTRPVHDASGHRHRSTAADRQNTLIVALLIAAVVALAVVVAVALWPTRPAASMAQTEAVPAPASSPAPMAELPQLPERVPNRVPKPVVASQAAPAPAPAPVTPAPAPAVAPAPPAEAGPMLVAEPNPLARRDLLTQLADLLLNERFHEALNVVARFPDPADRAAQTTRVENLHAQRRADIEAMIDKGIPTPRIAEALTPARTPVWEMPGDEEWASTVMARASTRHLSADPVAPPPVPVPAETTATAQATPVAAAPATTLAPAAAPAPVGTELAPVVVDPAVSALAQVVAALRVGSVAPAQAVATAQPTGTPTSSALHRVIALWQGRLSTVQRVITAKSAKLRIPHPTTGEAWDVIGVEDDHIAIAAANGSSSELAWSQVPMRVVARLWADAAQVPGASPVDMAQAAVMNALADEQATAMLLVKRAKAALVSDMAADVDLALDLNRRRMTAALLTRALEIAHSGTPRQAADMLGELRRLERAQVAGHDDLLSALERMSSPTAAPAVRAEAAPALPADVRLRQAALRTAGWDPVGNAYLDGRTVVIPAGSGISTPLPAKIQGYGLGVCGSGFLSIVPSRPGATGTPQSLNVPVSATTGFYTLKFTRDGVTLLDATGKVVDQIRSPDPTLITLRATADVRMPTVPQPLP